MGYRKWNTEERAAFRRGFSRGLLDGFWRARWILIVGYPLFLFAILWSSNLSFGQSHDDIALLAMCAILIITPIVLAYQSGLDKGRKENEDA